MRPEIEIAIIAIIAIAGFAFLVASTRSLAKGTGIAAGIIASPLDDIAILTVLAIGARL